MKQLREELVATLSEDKAVSLDHLVEKTSAESRREVKQVLRRMIDEGMLTTTPGFKYRLASSEVREP